MDDMIKEGVGRRISVRRVGGSTDSFSFRSRSNSGIHHFLVQDKGNLFGSGPGILCRGVRLVEGMADVRVVKVDKIGKIYFRGGNAVVLIMNRAAGKREESGLAMNDSFQRVQRD
ncbi:MAG: hypothetical protein ACE15F_11020 [bacterium]